GATQCRASWTHEVAPAGSVVADWLPARLVLLVVAGGAVGDRCLRLTPIRPASESAALRQHGGSAARCTGSHRPVAPFADNSAGQLVGAADDGHGRADVECADP